jgi:hypothetical protein
MKAQKGLVNSSGVDSDDLTSISNHDSTKVNGLRPRRESLRMGVQPGSIKEAALEVLRDAPDGLLALDVLKRINDRRMEPISRSSLSPQLTRLARAGLVALVGSNWRITKPGLAALLESAR